MRPLIALLQKSEVAGTADTAVKALGSLCWGNASTIGLAVASGALEAIVALLKRQGVGERLSAAWTLSGMLRHTTRNHRARVLALEPIRSLVECLSLGDTYTASESAGALYFLYDSAGHEQARRSNKALSNKILETCSPSCLLALLPVGNAATSKTNNLFPFNILALLDNIARTSGHHRALLSAGLPRKLVAALQSRDERSVRFFDAVYDGGFTAPGYAVPLWAKLLRGPHAAEAADALVASGALGLLVDALHKGKAVCESAAKCLHAISNIAAALRADIVNSGAVSALIVALHEEGIRTDTDSENSGPSLRAKSAAATLLLLAPEHESVEAAVAAAGFTTRQLQAISDGRSDL